MPVTYTDEQITEAGRAALNYLPYTIRRAIDPSTIKFKQPKKGETKGATKGEGSEGGIASVEVGDGDTIYVNDVQHFMDPTYTRQLVAHEATHLFQNRLAPDEQKKFPKVSDKNIYNYGGDDALVAARGKNQTMSNFSTEQQGAIVQKWAALQTGLDQLRDQGKLTPQLQRQYQKELAVYQPFINDYGTMSLATMMPTPATAKGLNTTAQTPGLPAGSIWGMAPFEHVMNLVPIGVSGMPIDPALSAHPQQPQQQTDPNAGAALTMGQQQQQPPQQVNPNMGGIVAGYLAAKQAKVAAATSEFDRNMKAQAAGFPIDPTKMGKLMKKMGLHPIEDPHEMAAWWQSQQSQRQQPQGQSPMGQVNSSQQQQPQQPNFNTMSKKDRRQYIVKEMGQHALAIANTQGRSAQAAAEHAQMIQTAQNNAMSDDPAVRSRAIGQLMAAGEWKLDLTQTEFAAADPAHRKSMIDVAAGYESEAQKVSRAQKITDDLTSTGKVTDPASAQKIGTLLANGQPIPMDLRAQMKPLTFSQLGQQADLAQKYIEMGVDAHRAMAMAEGGVTTLPTGVIPIVSQQLALQKRQVDIEQQRANTEGAQVGLEKERLGIELAKYNKESAALDKAATNEKNKQTLENFKNLVYMKQAGMTIPKDYFNSMLSQAAEASGLTVTEVHHWYGTTSQAFSLTPDNNLANSAAGASTTAPSPSVIQQVSKGVKKAKKVYNEATQGQTN